MEQAVPNHIGFILDGNRRWAKANGLPSLEGHRKGYENLKNITEAAFDRGVKVISAYIFSTENWNRSKEEVDYLMDLSMWVFKHELKEFEKQEVRVVFLGTMDKLSKKLQQAILRAEERTKHFTRGTLALCFNYSGQQEIVDAVKAVVSKHKNADEVNENLIRSGLYAPEIPDVDLVIRTSGEQRISNFMLWRVAYAELIFCSKFWPDYNADDLGKDIATYNKRQRRFGK